MQRLLKEDAKFDKLYVLLQSVSLFDLSEFSAKSFKSVQSEFDRIVESAQLAVTEHLRTRFTEEFLPSLQNATSSGSRGDKRQTLMQPLQMLQVISRSAPIICRPTVLQNLGLGTLDLDLMQ